MKLVTHSSKTDFKRLPMLCLKFVFVCLYLSSNIPIHLLSCHGAVCVALCAVCGISCMVLNWTFANAVKQASYNLISSLVHPYSNTARWTIPKFDFSFFYYFFLEIPKNIFTFSKSRSPLIWV